MGGDGEKQRRTGCACDGGRCGECCEEVVMSGIVEEGEIVLLSWNKRDAGAEAQ